MFLDLSLSICIIYQFIFTHCLLQKFINSSRVNNTSIEGPLIHRYGLQENQFCLDFSITLRNDGEQLYSKLLIYEALQVMGMR